jgi:glutaredoxin
MKFIRFILGKILLLGEKLFSPKSLTRPAQLQATVDERTKNLALYQFQACPFCIKVRMSIKRLGLNIEYRDVLKNKAYEDELIKFGGQRQTPCLKIRKPDGSTQWMYESSDIINFLEQSFAASP